MVKDRVPANNQQKKPNFKDSKYQGPLFLEFNSKMKIRGSAELISEQSFELGDS